MTSSDVTQILNELHEGRQSNELLPIVYRELRGLAEHRLKNEPSGQTLQATALVHEVYLRLVDTEHQQRWDSRHHFFAAAAEAMRRILIDRARHKQTQKRGGEWKRSSLDKVDVAIEESDVDLLELDEALNRLEAEDAQAATLVKLRYFSGFTVAEAANILDISTRSTERLWTFAKAWLIREMGASG